MVCGESLINSSMNSSNLSMENHYSYDDELERMWNKYQDDIQEEKYYILNSTFNLHNDSCIYIECGLSPARDFKPAIKLKYKYNKDIQISFDMIEWVQVVNHFKNIIEHYKDCDEIPLITIWENTSIFANTYNNIKIIHLSKAGTTLFLLECDIQGILFLESNLCKKQQMLNDLNFMDYYCNVLKEFSSVISENDYKHNVNIVVLNMIKVFCQFNKSIKSYCLHECLIYLHDKVLYDIENFKI